MFSTVDTKSAADVHAGKGVGELDISIGLVLDTNGLLVECFHPVSLSL